MNDSIKCATVTAMCCGPLLEHLQLNTARLQDFGSLRTEIERYIEGRHGLGDQHGAPGPQPMEVNGLGPPPGRRPAGGKGAPGGAAPPASSGSRVPRDGCWNCGGEHFAAQCPRPALQGASAQGKGKKGQGKGKKGKGPTKSKKGLACMGEQAPAAPVAPAAPAGSGTVFGDDYGGVNGRGEQDQWDDESWRAEGAPNWPEPGLDLLGTVDLCNVENSSGLYGMNGIQVNRRTGQRRLTLTLDSGAATTVIPPSTLPNQPLASGPTGAQYRSASGQVIRNEGVKEIATMYGCLRANVCATTKPPLAVSDLLAKGHRVEFAPDKSCIVLSNGRRLALKPGRGTFTVTLELEQPACWRPWRRTAARLVGLIRPRVFRGRP